MPRAVLPVLAGPGPAFGAASAAATRGFAGAGAGFWVSGSSPSGNGALPSGISRFTTRKPLFVAATSWITSFRWEDDAATVAGLLHKPLGQDQRPQVVVAADLLQQGGVAGFAILEPPGLEPGQPESRLVAVARRGSGRGRPMGQLGEEALLLGAVFEEGGEDRIAAGVVAHAVEGHQVLRFAEARRFDPGLERAAGERRARGSGFDGRRRRGRPSAARCLR